MAFFDLLAGPLPFPLDLGPPLPFVVDFVFCIRDHEDTVSIGGRNITNLRFSDDIDGLVGSENELKILVEKLDSTSTEYGMEISGEKTKIMTKNK